jgi:predicted nucleic acid-binding protein
MRTLIVDTSALYALVDEDDVHHAEAVAFLKQEGRHLTLVVIDTTLFEAITLIKSRLGQAVAARALKAIQRSNRYHLINLAEQERAETWRIFERYADKDWSPFDCACLAVARTRKIGEASAFDEHFDQMAGSGLIRLP